MRTEGGTGRKGIIVKHSYRISGFTLVELLVVIAIIGVLIALLLPAVQAAREAARRAHCTNNLKQIALGSHNYHDTFKVFPPGALMDSTSLGAPDFTNWAIGILPYIEQKPLYDQYVQEAFNVDPVNQPVCQTFIEAYACPSDIEVNMLRRPQSGPRTFDYRYGSYRAMSGRSNGHVNDAAGRGGWWDGYEYGAIPKTWRGIYHVVGPGNPNASPPSPRLTCEKFSTIGDGSSGTLAFGELHLPKDQTNRGTFWAYTYTSYNKSAATPYSGMLLANFFWDRCVPAVPTNNICKRGWGSYHPGGINFATADGSVDFVSLTIDMLVFCSLASIDGGEVIP
jgi:prepilin-type N-terminal cleavage/methylation domain-containing protein/prepilin-type processing-associated H-X9-DG protein